MIFEFEKLGRLPFNEFSTDLEYMPSMDSAWHNWLQPEYAEQFKKWESKFPPIDDIGRRKESVSS